MAASDPGGQPPPWPPQQQLPPSPWLAPGPPPWASPPVWQRRRRPGPAPGLVYAGFWLRVGALVIDLLLQFAILAAIGAALSGAGAQLLVAIASIGYTVASVALSVGVVGRTGGTVGMRVLRMRIVREDDGSPIGYALAAGRLGVLWAFAVATLGVGLLVDLVWIAVDPRGQSVHDKACSTLVVRPGW